MERTKLEMVKGVIKTFKEISGVKVKTLVVEIRSMILVEICDENDFTIKFGINIASNNVTVFTDRVQYTLKELEEMNLKINFIMNVVLAEFAKVK